MIIAERIVINEELKAYIHSNAGKKIKRGNEVYDFVYGDFEDVEQFTEVDEPTAEELLSILTGESE